MSIQIDTPQALGQLIREVRQRQGLRQDDLALTMATSHVALRQLEHGTARQVERLFTVLRELGIQISADVLQDNSG